MTKDETMSDDDDDGTVGLIATSSSNKHNGVGDDAVPEPFKTSKASSSSRTKSAWANIALARQQTWKQIVSYKSTYCIGFCANCLVVFIVLLLSSAIAQFPVIYLRVAELRAGELDLILSSSVLEVPTLNYSQFALRLDSTNDSRFSYHTPRRWFPALLADAALCKRQLDPFDVAWKYGTNDSSCTRDSIEPCFVRQCGELQQRSVTVQVISAARERRMGLGRGWSLSDDGDQPPGEAGLQATIFSPGGERNATPAVVYMRVDLIDLFGEDLWRVLRARAGLVDDGEQVAATSSDPDVATQLRIAYLPFNVTRVFADASGKFPGGANGVVVIDYDTLMPYVARYMSPNTPASLRNAIAKTELAHFATNIVANLPPDERVPIYLDTNADRLTKTATTFGSVIVYESGYSRVQTSMPCVDAMSLRWALSLLLSLLLDVIAAVLLFLSGVLVYALLGVDVERRANELGVLRLLGARRRRLIGLLLAHAAAYALPATVVGLIVAQCTMPFIAMALSLLSGAPASYWLSFDGVWRAVLLGIGMPALAGIIPISNALARSVASAFEARGAPAPTTQVTIERSESAAVSAPLLVAGSLTAVFGFGIYYLLPLSLLSLDIELLVDLFVALLCGMLLGMVLLSLNIATALQRVIAWLTVVWWESDIVGVLLDKNLVAHRGRHRKTVVVFAVSVAFIIFLSVSYSIQADEVSYQALQQNGADLLVSPITPHRFVPPNGREQLLGALAEHADVAAFTWATPPLADAAFVVTGTRGTGEPAPTVIKTVGSLKSSNVALYGVPANFFAVGDPRFLQPSDGTAADVAATRLTAELYGHDRTLVLGAADAKKLDVRVGDRLLVQPGGGAPVQFRVAGILDTSPYFSFSRFSLGGRLQTAIVSLPEFMALHDQVLEANAAAASASRSFFGNGEAVAERSAATVTEGLQTVPLGAILVQLKHGNAGTPSVGAVDRVRRTLRGVEFDLGESVPKLNYVDAQQRVGQLSSTTKVIFGFFGFATVMSMTISFFALVSSTYVTVLEQLREIGVLRSVGISRWRMLRCYVYEALVIVLSSVILGLLIGVAMGWTMSAQRILFSQLPIPFSVPWALFLIMCALSVVFGFVAAVLPLRSVLWKRTPVEIMRGRS